MAKMIPSVISPEIKSAAEKHIFEWFRDDPRTSDWIVLHSLGISNHNTVIHGETDFFILVPYMGLFALEVKGGRVKRKDGIWSFTDRYGNVGTKERGPFDQAWDGVFSIVGDIKSKLDPSHRYLENIFMVSVSCFLTLNIPRLVAMKNNGRFLTVTMEPTYMTTFTGYLTVPVINGKHFMAKMFLLRNCRLTKMSNT